MTHGLDETHRAHQAGGRKGVTEIGLGRGYGAVICFARESFKGVI